jgi:hypothetical protein
MANIPWSWGQALVGMMSLGKGFSLNFSGQSYLLKQMMLSAKENGMTLVGDADFLWYL